MGTITLAEYGDLLLDVFDFVFRFLKIDGFDGHNILRAAVDAFKDLTERALPNAF